MQVRLLPDHAVTVDFLHLVVRIGNDPVPAQQGTRNAARIGDGNGIGKYKPVILGDGLFLQVGGSYLDGELVMFVIIRHSVFNLINW